MPRIGLAQMLARFERALDVLGPDGLRETLRRHLEALPPSERDAFVASFEAPASQPGGLLLVEIDAYVEDIPDAVRELTEERWRRRSRRWEEWDDEPSPVRHDVDDLYRRLGERFLAGDLLTAIDGYRRLLDITVAAIDDPDGFHVSGSDDVQREALARLTWAVLADTSVPVEERAAHAVEVIDAYSAAVVAPTLHEVLSTRVEPLPDADLVLRSLQVACEAAARSLASWQGHRLADLSIELVVSLDGVDALVQLARDPTSPHDDRVRRAWLDELTSSGRVTDAIEVATAEHARIPASYARADLADRLAGLRRSTGDRSGAVGADLAAFADHPTLTRLTRLCDGADGDIRSFAAQLEAGREANHDQVRVAIDVLTGHLGRLAEPWPTTDRRSDIDDLVVAVGALLVASGPSSDFTATRLAAALVATVDLHPRRHELVLAERAQGERPRLAPYLLAAIEAEPPDPAWATTAEALVDQAAEVVLSGKICHRYDTIARLVVALAHTGSALDTRPAGETIGAYEQRYKRFSAFRRSLVTATEEARAAGRSSKPGTAFAT